MKRLSVITANLLCVDTESPASIVEGNNNNGMKQLSKKRNGLKKNAPAVDMRELLQVVSEVSNSTLLSRNCFS